MDELEETLWASGVKRAVAVVVTFLVGKQTAVALTWLQTHGVNVSFDVDKFQTALTALGMGAFAVVHHFIKEKTNWRWL